MIATDTGSAGALDLISGMAAKTKAKKRDAKPEINEPSLDTVIAEWMRRKSEYDTAESLMKAAQDQIVTYVKPKRLEICTDLGKVCPSLLINQKLTYTQQCRYSIVPEERSADLAAAFGPNYARFFRPTLAISLKKDSANNESVLTRLVEALGADFFAAHFDVKRDLLVQETFHHEFSCRKEVQVVAQPFMDEETIRAYSPSLKVT